MSSHRHPYAHRIPTALTTTLALGAAIALFPAGAQAGVGLSVTPTFPTDSTVGQTGLPASLTITNANTAGDVLATICNAGDGAPCAFGGGGITLMGSCAAQGGDSACVAADAGVFAISPTATGEITSACAGMSFTVTPTGDMFGSVRFTPVNGAHVALPTPGATCRIDFTVSVLRTPTTDAQPDVAGAQTIQVADALQRSNNATTGFARGSQTGTTVNPPPPVTPPPPPAVTPPTVTPPPPVPPPAACTPPPGPAPAGGSLCIPPIRGTAVMSGRTGCQGLPFTVQVHGRAIRMVVFRIDRMRVRTLTRPNRSAGRYALVVHPRGQQLGTHHVTATTSFSKASGTHARTLRVAYQRCSQAAVSPHFAG